MTSLSHIFNLTCFIRQMCVLIVKFFLLILPPRPPNTILKSFSVLGTHIFRKIFFGTQAHFCKKQKAPRNLLTGSVFIFYVRPHFWHINIILKFWLIFKNMPWHLLLRGSLSIEQHSWGIMPSLARRTVSILLFPSKRKPWH